MVVNLFMSFQKRYRAFDIKIGHGDCFHVFVSNYLSNDNAFLQCSLSRLGAFGMGYPFSNQAYSATPTVNLDYSTVVSVAGNSSIGYYKYQNIRFAAAPTGDLRWA